MDLVLKNRSRVLSVLKTSYFSSYFFNKRMSVFFSLKIWNKKKPMISVPLRYVFGSDRTRIGHTDKNSVTGDEFWWRNCGVHNQARDHVGRRGYSRTSQVDTWLVHCIALTYLSGWFCWLPLLVGPLICFNIASSYWSTGTAATSTWLARACGTPSARRPCPSLLTSLWAWTWAQAPSRSHPATTREGNSFKSTKKYWCLWQSSLSRPKWNLILDSWNQVQSFMLNLFCGSETDCIIF